MVETTEEKTFVLTFLTVNVLPLAKWIIWCEEKMGMHVNRHTKIDKV